MSDPEPPPDPAAPIETPPPARPVRFPIVGIGASAGGLAAIEELIRRLSQDGMAYVVVQHLAPGHESLLTDILSRATSLRVVTIQDRDVVTPNTIYVTPPGVDLGIRQGVLQLRRAVREVPRHSIDTFFRSLADDLESSAIGVVLSGAGVDGSLGLRAIKERGGITFAQEPSTASQPSMPQSAADSGSVDFCLAPADIGDELMRLSAHPYVARKVPPHGFGEDALAQIFAQLKRSFGVDFSEYKLATLERRLQRRMALQKLDRTTDYLRLLEQAPEELAALYGDLLIGVTSFFRDREPFEVLRTTVFPRLLKTLEARGSEAPLRIWVPGCSTGEEAYSVGICLLEALDAQPTPSKRPLQIFATDIDDRALARGRAAEYPPSIELDVSPARLQRFFSRHEKGYQVARQLREMVLFAHHNLAKDPPFSRLDLICCRNVLIYLQAHLQKRVLRVFHHALNPDGALLLGASESIGEASDLFTLVDRAQKLYAKKNVSSAAVFDFALAGGAGVAAPALPGALVPHRSHPSIQQLADTAVLSRFGPPGLLVADNLEVLQFRGDTGPYVAPSPGAATLSVLKLLRPELQAELRAALDKVARGGRGLSTEPVRLGRTGPPVVLEVMPLEEPATGRRCFLVLFHAGAAPSPPAPPGGDAAAVEGSATQIQELEHQLLVNRAYLQTTVQDLETANGELQSANEELQSANEELQSANEELETSKEELQSTNEELATVNEELRNRMAQLSVANDDLENVLELASAPLLIVGMDLRIRRYSREWGKLFSLIPADVGRPIDYLASGMSFPELPAFVAEAIDTVHARSQRVRCAGGRWYTMQVVPYKTHEHSIRGALVELLKVPPAPNSDDPLESHELVGRVLSTLPHVLMLLDDHLRIAWVNKAFIDSFLVGTEILGRPLEEVWASRTTAPALWNALEEAAARGTPFAAQRVEHPFGRTNGHPMTFEGCCIPGDGGRSALTLVVIEEVHDAAPGEGKPA